ncbi:MFS general substrate transporter [Coniochaeta hoffmannii]|uniref:MFS general substrate transporter n=1 Tax=Coniochaeta hoffmannii TaxID=91930 RepID=A0AA38RXG3_9PEZI|nr:MFS general substrate transporter [Coniochaeta hoffmannii]
MATPGGANEKTGVAEVRLEHPEHHHHKEINVIPIEQEAVQDAVHIDLTWRSWLVVFITCFAVAGQVFVVVAAGSVIAFIIRDIGDAPLAGWIIQGPLLMQAVLSPIVGRLSDVLDRKMLATVPPLLAFVGAVISAKATSMTVLIVGGILIGTTLSTISIVQAIPSEILPLKYRPIAQGLAGMGGTVGGLIGALGAGGMTNANPGGWRWIFWTQAIFHGLTSVGLFAFYWPPKNIEYPKMSLKDYIWACDPIGSGLFVSSATLILLGLDWAGGAYAWSNPHVAAPLTIGLVLLVAFGIYEWKGRADGLIAHIFFRSNQNFALANFAFAVEGWIFYSAVNSVVPQIVLNLGFEDNSWDISVRQLSYQCVIFILPLVISLYATRFKDLKSPLLFTFVIFLVVCILYATIKPSWSHVQYGINVLAGIGQAGPLTLLPACIQYTAPHAFLSTATGMAFSFRAIGGAMGSAVLNAIISGRLTSHYAPAVSSAAVGAGLPESSVPSLLAALETGQLEGVDGATPGVWAAALDESHWQYAYAYRLAWSSIIPFTVMAIVAIWFMRGVKELMTEKVEATVEHNQHAPADKIVQEVA